MNPFTLFDRNMEQQFFHNSSLENDTGKASTSKAAGKTFPNRRQVLRLEFLLCNKARLAIYATDNRLLKFYLSVIYLSQVFGLFPVSGLRSKDPKNVAFKWKSLRTLLSLCFVVTTATISMIVWQKQAEAGPITPSNMIGIVFFVNCFLICLLFFQFSLQFGDLMVQWTATERKLDKLGFVENPECWSMKKKLRVFILVALVSAFVEHLFSLADHYANITHRIKVCNKTSGSAMEDFITNHIGYLYPSVLTYNWFFGIVSEYVNFTCTVYWNLASVFIMIVSIGLACNFDKINYKIRRYRDIRTTDDEWCEVRECYNELSSLLKLVDKTLGKMIFLACVNDGYFILMQLLNMAR